MDDSAEIIAALRAEIVTLRKRITELEKQLGLDDDLRHRRDRDPNAIRPSPGVRTTSARSGNCSFFAGSMSPPSTSIIRQSSVLIAVVLLAGFSRGAKASHDIPAVAAVVTEHVRWDRWCGVCRKRSGRASCLAINRLARGALVPI